MNIEIALPNRSLDTPVKVAATSLNYILWVESTRATKQAHEYIFQGICFRHIHSVEEVSLLIREAKFKIDTIVISDDLAVSDIVRLKADTQQECIPLIMYSTLFSQQARDKTIRLGVDEYHYGAINDSLLKRLDFIKKMKKYKCRQSNLEGMVLYLKALPKIGQWALKRTFDIIGSSIALLAFFPIMILIAAIIKFGSKGPVFVYCKRVGLGYNVFNLYKFRTNDGSENDGSDQNFRRFLEESGLDELPSLINILKGDLSLVGSRPLLLSEAKKLTRDQLAVRFMTPVGVTGLWRVNGVKTVTENLDIDLGYASDNSFLLDLKILFLTFIALPLEQKI
jgi:lipopolysaccharide/colanic/teichoic acid biosynthesis glycosyltransferase